MASDPSSKTAHTYDAVAALYFERWRDRSAISAHIQRFSEMIHAYGLQGEIILDVGCGPGFDGDLLSKNRLKVIGVDLSFGMLRTGRGHFSIPLVQADMRYLPVAARIGGLWVSASMLHLEKADTTSTVRRFGQALVPGGLLYLSLKLGTGDGWSQDLYDKPRFFSYWQPAEVDSLLEAAGFSIVDGWQGNGVEDQWLIRFARKLTDTDGFIVVR